MIDWLWQGFISNGLWWLAVLLVGIAVAYIRKKYAGWAPPILYGLGAFLLTAGIMLSIAAWSALPTRQPQITPDNVETNIRAWLDAFSLATKRLPDQPQNVVFLFEVRPKPDMPILVARTRPLDRYLVIQANIDISPLHKALIEKLTEVERAKLFLELSVELARAKIGYEISFPLSKITVMRRVPITNNLTEDVFIDRIGEVETAVNLARQSFVLVLDRLATKAPSR